MAEQQRPTTTVPSITPEAFQISPRNIIAKRMRGRRVLYVSKAKKRKLERCARKKKCDRTFLDTDTDDTTDSYDDEDDDENDEEDDMDEDNNDVQEEENQSEQESIPPNPPVEFLMSLSKEELKEADENEEPSNANETFR